MHASLLFLERTTMFPQQHKQWFAREGVIEKQRLVEASTYLEIS